MKRSWTSVVLAAVLAVGGASAAVASPGGASADRVQPRPGQPLHVALGDSLAAGQQSVPPVADFATTLQLWKANGVVGRYHETLRQRLDCSPGRGPHAGPGPERRGSHGRPGPRPGHGCRDLGLVNLARPGIPGGPGGVTTATVLQPGDQLDQAVALIAPRNQDRSRRNDVEVVTVSVGGNDVFGPAVQACVLTTDACVPTLDATFAGFAERYDRILRTLRDAAGPDAVILTTTYYNPLPYCFLGAADPAAAQRAGDFILEGGELAPGTTMPAGFNDTIREVAARYDVTVADAFGLLGADDFVGGADCTHPDGSGHRALARAFAAAFPG